MRIFILIFSLLLPSLLANAQDADELFRQARDAAFKQKDYETAERLALQVLQKHPDYHDVRIFYGRLKAWDGDYSKADAAFSYVLDRKPDHLDARLARIDAMMWDNEPDDALEEANEGLKYHPGNRELLLRKGKAYHELDEFDDAAAVVDTLIKANRNDSSALKLLESIYYADHKFRLGAGYSGDYFDRPERPNYGPFHLGSLEAGKRFGWGTLLGRVNYANRTFSSTANYNDIQLEADAYPRITRGLYLYVNGGFSPNQPIDETNLFPQFRAGLEAFKSLPKSFEASLGFRYLDFDYNGSGNNVWIYTGSLGKYFGNYWINLRSYVRPSENGWSHTELLYFRKYWGSNVSRFGLPFFGQNFIGFYIGKGSTPLEPQFIEGDLNRLDSYRAGVEFQKIINRVWILDLGAGYEREQWNQFDRNDWGNRFTVDIKVMKLFFKSKYKQEKRYAGL